MYMIRDQLCNTHTHPYAFGKNFNSGYLGNGGIVSNLNFLLYNFPKFPLYYHKCVLALAQRENQKSC